MSRTRVRRRRLTWTVCATMLVVGLAGQGAHALGRDGQARDRSRHVVRAGDTLWSIAIRVSDGTDPRLVVDAIERANGIEGEPIEPGQALRIPTDA